MPAAPKTSSGTVTPTATTVGLVVLPLFVLPEGPTGLDDGVALMVAALGVLQVGPDHPGLHVHCPLPFCVRESRRFVNARVRLAQEKSEGRGESVHGRGEEELTVPSLHFPFDPQLWH